MMMRKWIFGVYLGSFILGISTCNSLKSQDFLKQLEEKLKKTAPKNPPENLPNPKNESTNKPGTNGSGTSNPSEKAEAPANPFLLPGEAEREIAPSGSRMKPPSGAAPPIELGPEQGIPPGNEGSVVEGDPGPGYLGLVAERIPGGGLGLLVVEITDNSPAWKAGFLKGDRILGVNGNAVSTLDDLANQLASQRAGVPIRFLISRNGRNKDIVAVPMDRSLAARTQPVPNQVAPYSDLNRGPTQPAIAGMSVADLSEYFRRQFAIPAFRGAAVTEVIQGSPAELAGLRPGDCIIEVDQRVVQGAVDLQDWIRNAVPGQTSTLAYYRGRSLNQVAITLGASDTGNPVRPGIPEITDSMLTPDYVSSLHVELDRVRQQLETTQNRLLELEQRLRNVEAARPRR